MLKKWLNNPLSRVKEVYGASLRWPRENDSRPGLALVAALVLLPLGLIGILSAGGCSRGAADPDAPKVIRWVVDPNPVRQEQIAGFEEDNPDVRVNLDPDAGSQKVLTQLAGRIYPDVFTIYDPATIRVFAKKNVLTDLRPLMEEHGVDLNDFWPQLRPYMQMEDGRVVGLPDNCGPYVLFYNKRLFREAGLEPPRDDWDWNDLLEAARKLTKKDSRGRTVQFGIGYIEPWIIFWQYGARMYSEDGRKCIIDSPEGQAAAKFWASFRLTERVTPTPSEEQGLASMGSWGGAGNLFTAERLGMFIAGRWMSIQYRKNRQMEWDVAPVPSYNGVKATLLASKVFSIPAGLDEEDRITAFRFLKYLTSKRNQMIVSSTGDGIPSVMEYAHSEDFLFNPDFPQERNNAVYLSEMEYARPQEVSPFISELDARTIFNEEMDLMWQGRQAPEQAVRQIALRINSIIRRNIANPNLMD